MLSVPLEIRMELLRLGWDILKPRDLLHQRRTDLQHHVLGVFDRGRDVGDLAMGELRDLPLALGLDLVRTDSLVMTALLSWSWLSSDVNVIEVNDVSDTE